MNALRQKVIEDMQLPGFAERTQGNTLPSGGSFPTGQRDITPAFGYGAPHLSTGGTSTLLIHGLPGAHYSGSDPACHQPSYLMFPVRLSACQAAGTKRVPHTCTARTPFRWVGAGECR